MTYIDPSNPQRPKDSFIFDPLKIHADSLNPSGLGGVNRFDSFKPENFSTYDPYNYNSSTSGLGFRTDPMSPHSTGTQVMIHLDPMFRPLM